MSFSADGPWALLEILNGQQKLRTKLCDRQFFDDKKILVIEV